MKLNHLLLSDLGREAKLTRRVLERVPEGKDDWKPHPKSMELGYLASLIATMPNWIAMMVTQNDHDLAAAGTARPDRQQMTGGLSLVDALDQSVAKAREALAGTNDEFLLTTSWKLRAGERILSEQLRHVFIRETLLHLSHHRGQLTVYLRLNDIPVPSIYGPSADERF